MCLSPFSAVYLLFIRFQAVFLLSVGFSDLLLWFQMKRELTGQVWIHFLSFFQYFSSPSENFRLPGPCVISGSGKITAISGKVFCDQIVMVEWQPFRRLFGGKMQIWTVGAWRTGSQVSSNNRSKYLVLLLLRVVV